MRSISFPFGRQFLFVPFRCMENQQSNWRRRCELDCSLNVWHNEISLRTKLMNTRNGVIFGLAHHHQQHSVALTFPKCFEITKNFSNRVHSWAYSSGWQQIRIKKSQTIDGNCSFIEIEHTLGHCWGQYVSIREFLLSIRYAIFFAPFLRFVLAHMKAISHFVCCCTRCRYFLSFFFFCVMGFSIVSEFFLCSFLFRPVKTASSTDGNFDRVYKTHTHRFISESIKLKAQSQDPATNTNEGNL